MRRLLFVLLLAGCHRHHVAPTTTDLGQSTAGGPKKPIDAADDKPQNVDVPISGPKTSPSDTGASPGPSDPPPDVP